MAENKLEITEKQEEGNGNVFILTGRIDTATAPEFEKKALEAVDKGDLVFDMEGVTYVSSAGLRVVLQCHKKIMAAKHKLTLRNLNTNVKEVFTISGLNNVLNIV